MINIKYWFLILFIKFYKSYHHLQICCTIESKTFRFLVIFWRSFFNKNCPISIMNYWWLLEICLDCMSCHNEVRLTLKLIWFSNRINFISIFKIPNNGHIISNNLNKVIVLITIFREKH